MIVCCSPADAQFAAPFPTIIKVAGYSPPALEATATLLFGQQPASNERSLDNSRNPRLWPVEQWNEARDALKVWDLWRSCVSQQFAMDQLTLSSLLRRPGYAKHYIVRNSGSGEILGFCAVSNDRLNTIPSCVTVMIIYLTSSKYQSEQY